MAFRLVLGRVRMVRTATWTARLTLLRKVVSDGGVTLYLMLGHTYKKNNLA